MQHNSIAFLAIAIVITLVLGCNDVGQPSYVPNPSGSFLYNGYDLNANVVLTGTINLNRQGDELTGKRNLVDTGGVVDSGQIGGIVHSDGTIEVMFDPNKLRLFYVVIIGKPTSGAITGDVFSSGERTLLKTGTFKLLPVNSFFHGHGLK